jgi:hypothetical protein
MADNTKQFELIVEIKKDLDWLFLDNPDLFTLVSPRGTG